MTNKQKPKLVVSEETKKKLDKRGTKGETYDEIINNLIKIAEKIKKS